MRVKTLWKLTVQVAPEAEEATGEMLSLLFNQPVASFTNVETGTAFVSQFFEKSGAVGVQQRGQIRAGLKAIQECGLQISPAKVRFTRVPPQDWTESWKKHFHPLRVGSSLLVRPSWSPERPPRDGVEVILDPGLSFGTGQHPTTAFCLEQMVRWRRPGTSQSLLDAGTGSGILAIAAAKLGYQPIVGFDFDTEAVRVAKENAQTNGVDGRIKLSRQDLRRLPLSSREKFSAICANLLTDLLLEEKQKLLSRLAPGGLLVLAGILRTEFSAVQAAYETAGLQLIASRALKEWRSGAFRVAGAGGEGRHSAAG